MGESSEPGRLMNAIPVLPSSGLEATLEYYRTKLGFEGQIHGNYLILSRDEVQLHFALSDDDHDPAKAPMCRVGVRGIDQLYSEVSRGDIIPTGGELTTEPWGMRQFAVRDEDGNCIVFQEPTGE